jgi:plasmid stabilization system protein ParE
VGVFRLTRSAVAEFDDILDRSEARFDKVGRMRYAALLVQAMQDVADDPHRDGAEPVRALGARVSVYHARHSRNHIPDPAERVHEPRHSIVFRVADDGVVDILGFVHDSMLRGRALRRIVRGNTSDSH